MTAPAPALRAQAVSVRGAVVAATGRDRPAAGLRVVLHRLDANAQGPIDSVRAGRDGRFRFTVARPESLAVYLVSAFYDGVAYFARPFSLAPGKSRALDTLRVYDTTSTGAAIRVDRRVLTVAAPGRDGTRQVLEIVELANASDRTRIARDTATPVWQGALPQEALEFQIGEGDFSPAAAERRGDSVAVFGAIQPGPGKQLTYQYVLPSTERTLRLPVAQDAGEMDFLLEDTTAAVSAPGLRRLSTESIEGHRYARYVVERVPAGALVQIDLPKGASSRTPILIGGIVVLAVALLAVAAAVALRRAPARAA